MYLLASDGKRSLSLEAFSVKERHKPVLYIAKLLYFVLKYDSKKTEVLYNPTKDNCALTSEIFLSIQQFPRLSSEGLLGFH